eukprot:757628-Hanusia_phi.AAC.1
MRFRSPWTESTHEGDKGAHCTHRNTSLSAALVPLQRLPFPPHCKDPGGQTPHSEFNPLPPCRALTRTTRDH